MSNSHGIVAQKAVRIVTGVVEVEEKSGREQAHRASVMTSAIDCAACSSARGKTSRCTFREARRYAARRRRAAR